MTISDLYDAVKLSAWLEKNPGGNRQHGPEWLNEEIAQNREDWLKSKHNQFKRQTWDQFIRECLREGLDIKSKGKTEELLFLAIGKRSDLYIKAEETNPI